MVAVTVCEVGPRDGLQNESVVLSTADRVDLIHRLMACGFQRIEVTSFVSSKRVPAMANAEEVVGALERQPGIEFTALALNERGAARAIAAAVDRINFALVVTETFNRKNQGATVAESVRQFEAVTKLAASAAVPCTATIGASFGCPFEGVVDPAAVVALANQLAEAGADEIVLADTIGVAVPGQVARVVEAVRRAGVERRLGLHLHNTRNTGLANAAAATELGIDLLDASVGGAGGCPFAPKATGNIPTEDLIYLLHGNGLPTGVDPHKVIATAQWLEGRLGHKLPGMLKEAGLFPPQSSTVRS